MLADATKKQLPAGKNEIPGTQPPTIVEQAVSFYNGNKELVTYGGLAVAALASYFLFFKKKKGSRK